MASSDTEARQPPGFPTGVQVGPHDFDRMKPTLRERLFGYSERCRGCYVPQEAHPVQGWVDARPSGDRTPPAVRAWML